jgi:hypothetical protein
MAEGTVTHERPVFLLTTGRSGSGVLQRALNCHRDLVIWGEHFGFLASAVAAIVRMRDPAQKHYPLRPEDNRGPACVLPTLRDPAAALEWVNPWSMQEYIAMLRAFVSDYFAARLASGQRWGFREVRYNTMPVLRGLQLLFPRAHFVFLKRDLTEVARGRVQAAIEGGHWARLSATERRARIHSMLREVREQFRVIDDFAVAEPGAATVSDFETLVAQPERELTRLLHHIGLDVAAFELATALRAIAGAAPTPGADDPLRALIAEVQESGS